MKTTGLLFLTMVWAAWTPGTVDAIPPSPESDQASPASSANTASGHPGDAEHAASPRDARPPAEGKASGEQPGHGRGSDTNHRPNGASLVRANHPKPLPNSRQRSLPGNALNVQQLGSGKPGGAAGSGFIGNETVHNGSPGRTSSAVRPTALSLSTGHHRSPNPAVAGGSLVPPRSNTAAINGTGMSHRH
jgi:hypothetical protein